jgi:prolyl-tRNA synthetase
MMGEEGKSVITQPRTLTTRKSEDFSEWFHQVIAAADIIDQRYPFQGFLVYKPWGWEILERALRILEDELTATGHKKCYFPAVVPEHLLSKEAAHIAAYHNEVFWINSAGKRKLAEPAALRPTSETIMYEMLKLWIRSWRDLPLKIHQSTSVWRYETKHTRPLIRDREIIWNEAHTSHATREEALEQIKAGVQIYSKLFEMLAIPVLFLNVAEVFPGATASVEPYTIFPDGRCLEMGSVNMLDQKFSKAFDVKFKKQDGTEDWVYQTSYGVSERLLAAIIAIHGDDRGLVLPPLIAPIQIVVVPILFEKDKEKILKTARKIAKMLNKRWRVHLDDRDITAGSKFFDWELRGVPVRIELGPRDISTKTVTVVRRDTMKKETVKLTMLNKKLSELLQDIHTNLQQRGRASFESKIAPATTIKEIEYAIAAKCLARIPWCGDLACASSIERSVDAPFIGYAYDGPKPRQPCLCGKPALHFGYVGKTY